LMGSSFIPRVRRVPVSLGSEDPPRRYGFARISSLQTQSAGSQPEKD